MESTLTIHFGTEVHLAHNRREKSAVAYQTHIRPDGTFEAWIDKDLHQVCQDLFEESIEAYNNKVRKARHPDRVKTLDSYIAECTRTEANPTTGKKKRYALLHEAVIYAGGKDGEIPTPLRKKILRREVDDFRKRNPNCIVFGAYYHDDERYWDETTSQWKSSAPHVHLDYIMVSRENKRGLRVQSSENGALRQMGYDVEKDESGKKITKIINGKKVHTYQNHKDIHICTGKTKYWTTDGRITSDRSDPEIALDETGRQRVAACTPVALWTADMQTCFEGVARQVCRENGVDLTVTHTSKDKPDQSYEWLSRQAYGVKQDKKCLEKAVEKLTGQKGDLTEESQSLSLTIAQQRHDVIIANAEKRKADEDRKAEEKARKLKEAEQQAENERLTQENTRLAKQNTGLSEQNADLSTQVEDLSTQVKDLSTQVEEKETQLTRLKSQLKKLRLHIQELLKPFWELFNWEKFVGLNHDDMDIKAVSSLEEMASVIDEALPDADNLGGILSQKKHYESEKYIGEEEERNLW